MSAPLFAIVVAGALFCCILVKFTGQTCCNITTCAGLDMTMHAGTTTALKCFCNGKMH